MGERVTSPLTAIDWNSEWKRLQSNRRRRDNPEVWDEKAKSYPVKHGSQEGYVSRFLELAGIDSSDTVFDMGCGTGALATPLALMGAHVIACDFSTGMLEAMQHDQNSLGISNVEAHLLSWDEDWELQGFKPKSVDVAIASRSIATTDLKESLMKLDSIARRRVCITLPCGPSPRLDDRITEAAGLGRVFGRDFTFAFNILVSEGINPEVNYIPSNRLDYFSSPDEAAAHYYAMIVDALQATMSTERLSQAEGDLRFWLEQNLVHDEYGYHLSEEKSMTWAFMAWEPK